MKMYPTVSIGIVSWNSEKYLLACLRAIRQQDYPNLEFTFVDNDSSDHSGEILSSFSPKASIICNSQNRGFCGGHNQGIAASTGQYYLPLNPDVILEPTYISAAVEALESSPAYGMVAARLYLGTGKDNPPRIDSTGLFLDRKRRQYLRGFGQIDSGNYEHSEEVFGVDGAAPLYRRAMLEDIQIQGEYFDEAFFAHKEDVDLAWRARILGWRCIYTPQSVAFHQRTFKPGQRKTIGTEVKIHAVKNRYLLLLKNESSAGWKRDWAQIAFYDLQILAYMLVFERKSLPALKMVLKERQRALAWRAEIQRRAKVPPIEQVSWFKDPE